MAHEFTPVESDLVDLLNKTYIEYPHNSFIRVNGVFLMNRYKEFADAIENLEVRDDDIWVCSFPKTGTTWTQEMVWCIANDLDFEGAKVPLGKRFPFLEVSMLHGPKKIEQRNPEEVQKKPVNTVRFVEELPSPRFIKTHLPFNLLPRQLRNGETKAKIVYVVRNAKDTCISYYYHTIRLERWGGSFEDFCNLFIRDAALFAPFWTHVLNYWEKKSDDKLLFLKYEDMKKDLPKEIQRTAAFLGKNLTNDQLSTLAEHLSFANMKENPAVNKEPEDKNIFHKAKTTETGTEVKFMRKGTVDQWKTDMSPECIKQFDDWTRECLKSTSLASYWQHSA